MTQIGTFTRKDDGFFGRIRTLAFDAEVSILPVDQTDTGNAPDHRVFAKAWKSAPPGIAPASGRRLSLRDHRRSDLLRSDPREAVRVRHQERHLEPALDAPQEAGKRRVRACVAGVRTTIPMQSS